MRFEFLFRPLGRGRDAQASPARRPWYKVAPVTLGFVALVAAIFGITWLIGGKEGGDRISTMFAADVSVLDGEWWTLLASGFFHCDWEHLRSNCTFILIAGVILESVIGSAAMAGLILITILAGSATYLVFGMGPAIGASGMLFGIYGALLAHPLQRDRYPVFSWRTWAPFLVLMDLRGAFLPFDYFGVSAHMGGLVAGALYGAVLRPRWEQGSRWRFDSPRVAAAAMASLALIGVLSLDLGWATKWHSGAAYRADHFGDAEATVRHARFVADNGDWRLQSHGLATAGQFLLADGDSLKALYAMKDGVVCYGTGRGDYFALLGTLRSRLFPTDELHAELDLFHALELEPTSPYALDALARFWISANDTTWRAPKHAIGIALSAVREDGAETPEYMDTLAQAYFMTGNRQQAVYWMRRVLKLELEEDARAEYEKSLREMERGLVKEGGAMTLVEDRS